jgi:hypothetical protein
MNTELKKDIIASWNELEEVSSFLKQHSDSEILECLKSIQKRIDNSLHWLSKYIDDDDIIEQI